MFDLKYQKFNIGYAIETSHNLQLYLCGGVVLEFHTGMSRAVLNHWGLILFP